MKRFLKITVFGAVAILVLLSIALGFVFLRYPKTAPASGLAIELSAARVERGAYLLNHVLYCMNCHAERDWDYYGGPVVVGTEGKGAFLDDPVLPAYSANLTPFALGDWTDGEIVRAITAGVNNEGNALNLMMPYDSYARMSQEDVFAIVAYLRTLPPIEYVVPEAEGGLLAFVLTKVIGRVLPKPYERKPHPDTTNPVAYGEYLVKIAECGVCHSSDFAGGPSFHDPPGQAVRAKNITPAESGIGTWSRANFVSVFKAFAAAEIRQTMVPAGEPNTGMPWLQYAGMSERDLGAIYDYLRTLKAVEPEAAN